MFGASGALTRDLRANTRFALPHPHRIWGLSTPYMGSYWQSFWKRSDLFNLSMPMAPRLRERRALLRVCLVLTQYLMELLADGADFDPRVALLPTLVVAVRLAQRDVLPYEPRLRPTADSFDATRAYQLFRFTPPHLRLLVRLLRVPTVYLHNRAVVQPEEALLVLLDRRPLSRRSAAASEPPREACGARGDS
jgi:hypothetical protein